MAPFLTGNKVHRSYVKNLIILIDRMDPLRNVWRATLACSAVMGSAFFAATCRDGRIVMRFSLSSSSSSTEIDIFESWSLADAMFKIGWFLARYQVRM